jgi:hypothetical protein
MQLPREYHFDVRLDAIELQRLDALAARLEMPRAAVMRFAVRELAERYGIAATAPSAAVLPPG